MYSSTIKHEWETFLDQWQWSCHIILTHRRECHRRSALRQARAYLNKLKKHNTKMKFSAALLATSGPGRNHVHILICCDENYPIMINDIGSYTITSHWTQGNATVTRNTEWTNETISKYLIKKKNMNLNDPDSYDLEFYRPQLLNQLKRNLNLKNY